MILPAKILLISLSLSLINAVTGGLNSSQKDMVKQIADDFHLSEHIRSYLEKVYENTYRHTEDMDNTNRDRVARLVVCHAAGSFNRGYVQACFDNQLYR